jgi:hypothetical protein
MERTEKDKIRYLILSNDSDSVELGLILNERFKVFHYTARFYKKYKKYKFWNFNRPKSVMVIENRYWSVAAVLNSELKTHICNFWLDFESPWMQYTDWQKWQLKISRRYGFRDFKLTRKYKGHPYTSILAN